VLLQYAACDFKTNQLKLTEDYQPDWILTSRVLKSLIRVPKEGIQKILKIDWVETHSLDSSRLFDSTRMRVKSTRTAAHKSYCAACRHANSYCAPMKLMINYGWAMTILFHYHKMQIIFTLKLLLSPFSISFIFNIIESAIQYSIEFPRKKIQFPTTKKYKTMMIDNVIIDAKNTTNNCLDR
jgi:hypothetical protein